MDAMDAKNVKRTIDDREVRCFSPPWAQVISLACEISAYASDENEELPLF
jgi:hypothetical protein